MSEVRVLVTGGAGYIGAHCCKALNAAGFVPVVLDNLEGGHRDFVRWGPLEIADVRDSAAVAAVIERHAIDAVMHFAAHISVGESVADPGKYYRNNVGGTVGLLEAMVVTGVKPLVFSSTAAVYGLPETCPIPESAPIAPINPYGRSKAMSEQAIADHAAAHGVRFVLLRYFNACGADPDGEIGEAHEPETHLIPLAIEAALGGRELTVFGDDYPTPDGTCIRDYVHVADLADAHVAALRALLSGASSTILNLGTGQGVSVRELLGAVEHATGRSVPSRIGARRPGDPAELVADPALANRTLGWKAQRSDIATIVESAWAWHRRSADESVPQPGARA